MMTTVTSFLILLQAALSPTVVRLEGLHRTGVEVVQLEVALSFQREAEALGGALLGVAAPQHVLGEAAGPGAHVGEVQHLLVPHLLTLAGTVVVVSVLRQPTATAILSLYHVV